MAERKGLSASLEDYLEATFIGVQESGVARVRDIAKRVGVSMPSVNTALKRLAEQGLVTHEPYEFVQLTEQGLEAAGRIHRRHEILRRFLADVLGVPSAIAEEDACRMEHGLHRTTVTQLRRFLEYVDVHSGDELAPCVRALRWASEGAASPALGEGEPDA